MKPEKPADSANPETGVDSPPWSTTTKAIVATVALVLGALIIWRFQTLIPPLVIAIILAYLLNPAINLLVRRASLQRSTAVLVVYATLALVLLGGALVLGYVAVEQALRLSRELPQLLSTAIAQVQSLPEFLPDQTFTIGPYTLSLAGLADRLDWNALADQAMAMVEPAFRRGGSLTAQLAQATLNTFALGALVFVISIYIAHDIPHVGATIGNFAQQPGYRKDADRLMREFSRIWDAYLRGQIILGLVMGITIGVGLALLGVNNALGLGLLSGLLEFLPIIGPLIGVGAAILVALFQPDNYLGLSPIYYALTVTAFMFVAHQIENNLLVPQIVGDALDLHPLLVMVGVIMGASLAGILGAILAAPVLASLKLLGAYAWRKLLDLPPFPETEPETPPAGPSMLQRLRQAIARMGSHVFPGPRLPTGRSREATTHSNIAPKRRSKTKEVNNV